MVMVMAMVMERGKLKPLLLLKPMLSQVIIIMATLTDMAMDMDMARGRLPPVIIIMVMDMVEADAEPGYYHHGYSHGYGHGYGYGKREAAPGYYHHGYGYG